MAATKVHVKKGDQVLVISGKDKGKKGKVIEVKIDKSRVLVEGVNKVKKHAKPNQKIPQGGIQVREAFLHSSNVMLVCRHCGEPTRIEKALLADGTKSRKCKHCSELIDK